MLSTALGSEGAGPREELQHAHILRPLHHRDPRAAVHMPLSTTVLLYKNKKMY